MSEHPESHNGVVHPSVKYEPTDLSLRAILTFSAALVAALVVVVAGLFLLVWLFLGTPPRPEPVEQGPMGLQGRAGAEPPPATWRPSRNWRRSTRTRWRRKAAARTPGPFRNRLKTKRST